MSKLHAQAHALARYLHVVYMYIAQHNTVFLCINMDSIVDIPAVSSLARVLHHPLSEAGCSLHQHTHGVTQLLTLNHTIIFASKNRSQYSQDSVRIDTAISPSS